MSDDRFEQTAPETEPNISFRNGLDLARDFYFGVVADLVALPLSASLRAPFERGRAGSRSAVWAPQDGDGHQPVLEFSTLPGAENVAPAPS